ncbi:MAG: hypothetical protein AB8C84_09250 [Oligoflexales bacterium]
MLKWVFITFFCASPLYGVFLFGKSGQFAQQYAERELELKKSIDEYSLKAQKKIQSLSVEKEAECSSKCFSMVRKIEDSLKLGELRLQDLQRACSEKKKELLELEESFEVLVNHIESFQSDETIVFKVCDDVYELDVDMLLHPCVCFSALQVMLLNTRFEIPHDDEKRVIVSKKIIDKKIFKWIYNFIENEGRIDRVDDLSFEQAKILYKRSDYYGLTYLMKFLEEEFGCFFILDHNIYSINGMQQSIQKALSQPDAHKWLASLDKKNVLLCVKMMFIDAIAKDRREKRSTLRGNRARQLFFQRFWMLSLRCWLYGSLKSLEKTTNIERREHGDIVQTLEWYTFGFGIRRLNAQRSYHPLNEHQYYDQIKLLKTSRIQSVQIYPVIEKKIMSTLRENLYKKNIDKYLVSFSRGKDVGESICFYRGSDKRLCASCEHSLDIPDIFLYPVEEHNSEYLKIWNEIQSAIRASFPSHEF